MNYLIKLSLLGVIICNFAALSQAQSLTELQKTSIEKEIDSIFQKNVKAAENLDAETLIKIVDDNHKAGFITNDGYYSSFDSLMKVYETNIQRVQSQKIDIQKKKITVLSPNIAILTTYGTAKATLNSGQEFSVNFAWSFIYENIDNKWKVIHLHQSRLK